MSITNDQLFSLTGSDADVIDVDGDKVGGIGQLYVDETAGDPSWVTAKTGLFGTSASVVPADRLTGDDNLDYASRGTTDAADYASSGTSAATDAADDEAVGRTLLVRPPTMP